MKMSAADLEEDEIRWSLFRVKLIGRDPVYVWRLYIIQTPLFSIMLHRIFRPDRQRDLHDHPWNFVSFLLRGTYQERVPHPEGEDLGTWISDVRWINAKRAEGRHSIVSVSRSPVWTLVFTGRYRRDWGFWIEVEGKDHDDEGPSGVRTVFVPHREYFKLNDA